MRARSWQKKKINMSDWVQSSPAQPPDVNFLVKKPCAFNFLKEKIVDLAVCVETGPGFWPGEASVCVCACAGANLSNLDSISLRNIVFLRRRSPGNYSTGTRSRFCFGRCPLWCSLDFCT